MDYFFFFLACVCVCASQLNSRAAVEEGELSAVLPAESSPSSHPGLREIDLLWIQRRKKRTQLLPVINTGAGSDPFFF